MNNGNFTHNKNNTPAENLIEILTKICIYFVSALFIWWSWNILAPHLNAPLFSYREIFAMRMALSSIVYIFRKK